MSEERKVLLHQESEEDSVYSLSLRPERLDDFVGQKEVVENLRVAIAAAKHRGEPKGVMQERIICNSRCSGIRD